MPDQRYTLTGMSTPIDPLAAANEKISRLETKLQEEKTVSSGLLEKLKAAEAASSKESYQLTQVAPGSTCSRYDGLQNDGKFIWHEAISFSGDAGYDQSVLFDRAIHSVRRALGEDSGDRLGENCDALPPFSRDLSLEVIVRIVP